MITAGMCSCAIAVQFCPHGFALPCFVALPLVCPTLWKVAMATPLFSFFYTCSLPALLSIGTYSPVSRLLIDKFKTLNSISASFHTNV